MFDKAGSSSEEQARRLEVLNAARSVFNAGDGRLPTAHQIAIAAHLKRRSIDLCFKTKEEVFATLLLEGWIPVLNDVSIIFDDRRQSRSAKVSGFIAHFVSHLEMHPELLKLGAIWAEVLEKNLNPEALTIYKLDFTNHLVRAGDSVDRALRLAEGRGVQILMRTHALTRGLWEEVQHEESAAAVNVLQESKYNPTSFIQEVTSATTEYWRGALARSQLYSQSSLPRNKK